MGRLMFAATALEIMRPFLGPIYAWTAAVSHLDALALPAAIRLVLEFLLKLLRTGHNMVPIPLLNANPIERFRTDARAEGEEVWVGGWAISDKPNDRGACCWFGESYRSIATLELMATLPVEAFGLPQAGTAESQPQLAQTILAIASRCQR